MAARRLGLETGDEAELLDERERQKSLSWLDWLVLEMVVLMFLGWPFRPTLSDGGG